MTLGWKWEEQAHSCRCAKFDFISCFFLFLSDKLPIMLPQLQQLRILHSSMELCVCACVCATIVSSIHNSINTRCFVASSVKTHVPSRWFSIHMQSSNSIRKDRPLSSDYWICLHSADSTRDIRRSAELWRTPNLRTNLIVTQSSNEFIDPFEPFKPIELQVFGGKHLHIE